MNENKKKLTTKSKVFISVAAVIVAIVTAVVIVACTSNLPISSAVHYYVLMPHEIESETEAGPTLKMGAVISREYSRKEIKQSPLLAFKYYYYDVNGEKHDVDSLDTFNFAGEKVEPSLIFSIATMQRISEIKSALSKIIPIAIILVVVLLIFIWYRIWSIREDREKERNNKNKKSKKNKKK